MNDKTLSKEVISLDHTDPGEMMHMLTEIRNNPQLAQRYVDVMDDVMNSKEHNFSVLERDMFVSIKVMYDKLYEKSLRSMDFSEDKDIVQLIRLVKDMYETINKTLLNTRIKDRAEKRLNNLPKISVDLKEDEQVEVKVKKVHTIDAEVVNAE